MRDTYLTIDLDFWNGRDLDLVWLNKVAALDVKKFAVIHHHHIIRHANVTSCSRLINVDYHSDIGEDEKGLRLSCGTWGNFIKWAKRGRYIWIYPDDESVENYLLRDSFGRFTPCSGDGTCYREHSPFSKSNKYTKWGLGKVTRRLEQTPRIDLSRVAYVAFCQSPDYSNSELIEPFNRFLSENNIPWVASKESVIPNARRFKNL